jgi:glycosyltransferase involved in cell wall biosynthesis
MTNPKMLFVGAFPPPGHKVFGGNVTDCKTLLDAGLPGYFDLVLLDSTYRSVPPPPLGRRFIDSLLRLWRYLHYLAKFSPDAILIFSSTGFSFLEKSFLAMLGRSWGSLVLFFPRGGRLMDDCRRNKLYQKFAQLMLRFPHVLLCQGGVWRDFFINEMNFPSDRCVVLKSWTATPPLLKIGEERSYFDEDRLRILFLGSVYRRKGIFELIDAVDILQKTFPRIELLIAGEGEASDEARNYVSQKGLESVVHFLGWIDGERKLRVLADATIFCLPSHAEGLPNAMIEAMATGLPVVVTRVGSIPDAICDRQNGLIVPAGDTHALAIALEELVINPELRDRIGRSAYKTAKSDYTPEQAVVLLASLAAELQR